MNEADEFLALERSTFRIDEIVYGLPKSFRVYLKKLLERQTTITDLSIDFTNIETKDLYFFICKEQWEMLKTKHDVKGTVPSFSLYLVKNMLFIEQSPIKVAIFHDNGGGKIEKKLSRNTSIEKLEEICKREYFAFCFGMDYHICPQINLEKRKFNAKTRLSFFLSSASTSSLLFSYKSGKNDLLSDTVEDTNKEYYISSTCVTPLESLQEETIRDPFALASPSAPMTPIVTLGGSVEVLSSEDEIEFEESIPFVQSPEEIKKLNNPKTIRIISSRNMNDYVEVRVGNDITVKQMIELGRKALKLNVNRSKIKLIDYMNRNVFHVYEKDDEVVNNIVELQLYLLDIRTNGRYVNAEMKRSYSTGITSHYNAYSYSMESSVNASQPGLVGLHNLGNTCYMNSGLQCLIGTVPLRVYMMSESNVQNDLNPNNPLSRNGEFANAFSKLVIKMWKDDAKSYVSPSEMKSVIGKHIPQFASFGQQDAQELLSGVLDGLHEDLNRIRQKPYVEIGDFNPKKETPEEYAKDCWEKFKLRNDSIITDIFFGQTRTLLDCPVCKTHTFKFEPFSLISVPIPKSNVTYKIFVVPLQHKDTLEETETRNEIDSPLSRSYFYSLELSLPEDVDIATFKAEVRKLGLENFAIFEQGYAKTTPLENDMSIGRYSHYIVCELPSTTNTQDTDKSELHVVYPIRKVKTFFETTEEVGNFIFVHISKEGFTGKELYHKVFEAMKQQINNQHFLDQLTECFERLDSGWVFVNSETEKTKKSEKMIETDENILLSSDEELTEKRVLFPFHLEISTEASTYPYTKTTKIIQYNDEASTIEKNALKSTKILLCWNNSEDYSKFFFKSFMSYGDYPVFNRPNINKSPPTSSANLTLSDCINEFSLPFVLGVDDMWYCPNCKTHRQATIQVSLWKTPKVLIVALKRFRGQHRSKITDFVDYPETLSLFDQSRNENVAFQLFAISNHIGSLHGGHYTAYVKQYGQWYEYDDSHVSRIDVFKKDSYAYVLFYERKDTQSSSEEDIDMSHNETDEEKQNETERDKKVEATESENLGKESSKKVAGTSQKRQRNDERESDVAHKPHEE